MFKFLTLHLTTICLISGLFMTNLTCNWWHECQHNIIFTACKGVKINLLKSKMFYILIVCFCNELYQA